MSYIFKTTCLFFCFLLHTAIYSGASGINESADERPFITTWKTDNPGTSASNQITIPTSGTGYNYNIYWENVNDVSIKGTATAITGNTTITFPAAGTYRVEINGNFPLIYFNNEGDKSKILSVDQWGSIIWRSMESAFYGCNNLIIPAIDAPDLSMVTSLQHMFYKASNFNQPIGHWDVSKVTNIYGMFMNATNFNQNIESWDVSNVTNMGYMFSYTANFNQNIGSWNVGKVTNMESLFGGATNFNQDISKWDVSKVTNMGTMFYSATRFNQNIGNWNVSNVKAMQWMFAGATSFNQNINSWNVGKVTDMRSMFEGATAFNGPIGDWDLRNVTNMGRMFSFATNFNQDITKWKVGKVTDMSTLFAYASSFNQNIGKWDIQNVTTMASMLNNSGLSIENYNQILKGWLTNPISIKNNVKLGANGLKYCAGDSARKALIKDHSWIISGDILSCSQTITFSPLKPKILGDAPFKLVGMSSSGTPVTYTSSNTAVVTISGDTATIVGIGSTTITASLPEGDALPVQQVLNVETVTGLSNTENTEINIYPNPFIDYFEIHNGGKQINSLILIDLNGKNVLELNVESERADISSLNSGIYFLKVGTTDKTQHFKLIKN